MAGRRVRIPEDIQGIIAELHPETKRKVRAAIDAIAEDPTIGEPLEQELTGFRKIAIGAWRIVYREERRTVVVRAVGRRVTVYSDLLERLQKGTRERRGRYRRTTSAVRASRLSAAPGPLTRRGDSRGRAR